MALTGSQRKYLRGLAHGLKPVVLVGRGGVSAALLEELDQALESHELIKVRFNGFKEEKKDLIGEMARVTGAVAVGLIGHIAILFRPRRDPDKRMLQVPKNP
ncbi:MAG: ribosome assembly RNA-binding protein YhbY [Magnetococcales bacterium]|nr:ribosome assembly RNA-binding protein YhbY [Magnetococcales bacterium]